MAKKTKAVTKKAKPLDYSVAERIKFIREARKLTQNELGLATGLTQSTIANLENGKKDPSIQTLLKIANGLDIHVAILFSTDEVFVFDMKRLRRKYSKADKLTPHLYMALGRVVQYAKDIGFI
ncbi:MAG: helix-turn-helix transcriptional regulator [Pseudobdellovibrio sp.]